MRRVLAHLKGNPFLNTTRQFQKFSTNAIIMKKSDYMRRVENRLAHLPSWLVFPTRADPLEASWLIGWLAHVIAYPWSQKRIDAKQPKY